MEISQLRILSWNINGLKSITSSLKEFLDNLGAEIICFQETKTTRDQLDEATANVEGYTSYFSFSKRRSGYSGVVTFCKDGVRPYAAEEGLTGILTSGEIKDNVGDYGDVKSLMESDVLQSVDAEGRAVLTKHKLKLDEETNEVDLVIINVYCPRADPERTDRKEYKLRFYEVLEYRARAILDAGCHIIILGDINTCHRLIDCCDKDIEDFDVQPSRIWINNFIYNTETKNGGKFVDTYRYFHPKQENAFTCWCTYTNARENNYGQRIDYIFADITLSEKAVLDCVIMPEVRGSDHCPVSATLRGRIQASRKFPSLCSRNWPEFSGKQSKLSNFVQKIPKDLNTESVVELNNGKHKLEPSTQVAKRKQPKLDFFLKAPNKASSSELVPENLESPVKSQENTKTTVSAWKGLLKGPPPAPLCKGHKEPAVLRVCKKSGQNFKRQFYSCAKPAGPQTDPNSNCNFFQWLHNTKSK